MESKKRRKSVSPSPGPSPRPTCQVVVDPHSNVFGFEQQHVKELGACCNSPVADIEAKISGSNVVLKIISRPIPGQIAKIICVLERLSFEVLHLNISTMEDTVLYSFVIKVYHKPSYLINSYIYICLSFYTFISFLYYEIQYGIRQEMKVWKERHMMRICMLKLYRLHLFLIFDYLQVI